MDKEYTVCFEIAGPAAMFTRPDTGAAQVSYPVPTYSAAKGMFEAVARLKSVYIRPTMVEICAPIKYHKYVTNYGGPLRKTNQMSAGSSYQLMATILIDVCYRIYGIAEPFSEAHKNNKGVTINHLHALKGIFDRRLEKGQFFYMPCLGWKEFAPSYMGPLRPESKVETTINLVIPSILYTVFDQPEFGKPKPVFRQDQIIVNGVMEYA